VAWRLFGCVFGRASGPASFPFPRLLAFCGLPASFISNVRTAPRRCLEICSSLGHCIPRRGPFRRILLSGILPVHALDGCRVLARAAVLSLLFGYVHHGNSGESWLGAFAAGIVGLLFCLLLRRTGDLWMPIGFHAAWDWGETYFYSVPDSGLVAPGHLLNSTLAGPRWLSGGSVGPEASWLCLLLLVFLWCIFPTWLREVKLPEPRGSPGSS